MSNLKNNELFFQPCIGKLWEKGDTKPNPSDYEIVFAFIDESTKQLPESLPFFTKLNFMQTTRALNLLGFNVSKLKIKKSV